KTSEEDDVPAGGQGGFNAIKKTAKMFEGGTEVVSLKISSANGDHTLQVWIGDTQAVAAMDQVLSGALADATSRKGFEAAKKARDAVRAEVKKLDGNRVESDSGGDKKDPPK